MRPRSLLLLAPLAAALILPATALAGADLTVTLTHTPEPVPEESSAVYTLSIHNAGPDTATSVTSESKPSIATGLAFAGAVPSQGSGTLNLSTQVLDFNWGDIPAGTTATLALTYQHHTPETIHWSADAATTAVDPDSSNDTASDTATVTGLTAAASFADEVLGTIGPVQTITVTNLAGVTAPLGPVTLGGANVTDFFRFPETDTCSNQTLATGASCSMAVRFAPSALGARSAGLTLTPTSGAADPLTIPLDGNGVAAPEVRGPVGPAGPAGPAGPSTPVTKTQIVRLIVVPVDSRLRVRAGRRVTFRYVSTATAPAVLSVMKGHKRVASVRGTARRGPNRLRWNGRDHHRKAHPGRYTLRLVVGKGSRKAVAHSRLVLTRR